MASTLGEAEAPRDVKYLRYGTWGRDSSSGEEVSKYGTWGE
jgi:hypothetical protein